MDNSDIALAHATLADSALLAATTSVNETLVHAAEIVGDSSLQLFDIMDMRMLSGLIGEMFVTALCEDTAFLSKNPNIDGYPDALDISSPNALELLTHPLPEVFLKFPHGGLEVKNTFGVKKAKATIPARGTRIAHINRRLVWKAHHRETNNLIALQSDFIDSIPQVIAVFFADDLNEADWTVKQQPGVGSTMTSFCQTTASAFGKLKRGLRLYRCNIGLEQFLA